jgi:hypothetical protein
MLEKIVVVVYDKDLPQFELMCYCLNKNWIGNKYLTVVYQDSAIEDEVRNIVAETFDDDWFVNVSLGVNIPTIPGHDKQQINKILYSIDSNFENVLVLDCKDFLLKPTDFSFFLKEGIYYQVQYNNNPDLLFYDHYPEVSGALDYDTTVNVKSIYNVTPWFWNVAQLQKLWDLAIHKYGPMDRWKSFPLISEFASYYLYSVTDPEANVKFNTNRDFMPFEYVYSLSSIENDIQSISSFINFDFKRIWKHHRNSSHPTKTVITASILQKFDIPIDIILRWVNKKHNILT